MKNMNPPHADRTNPQEDAPPFSGEVIGNRTPRPNASAIMSIAAEEHTMTDMDREYVVAEVKPLPTVPIRRLPATPLVRPARRNWGDQPAPLPAASDDDGPTSSLTEKLIADRESERY